MTRLARGRFAARLAETAEDVGQAQGLRALAFGKTPDADAFDALCDHVLVQDAATGQLVCCFRLLPLASGAEIGRSYSAQFYDLSTLTGFDGALVEMGRFCLHPDHHDPDILRVAWGAMTAYVDARGVKLLFGCTSFAGTESTAYGEAFALLKARYVAPERWLPRVKAAHVVPFAGQTPPSDARQALRRMPPLLRSYLMMGGWVSDHAVVDTEMNTLHVFTGVEIALIPPTRQRLLRAVAG